MALVVNDKNKASFFQRLFSCSPTQNSAIAYEVLRLCKILFPQYREHFLGEYESLVEEANKYINENPQALSAVYSDLSSKHLLTQRYTAAFITVEAKRTISSDNQFDNYKAITLLVITYLSFRGNHEHKELCNDVRQWALGRREKSYLNLPDIEGFDFDALIKALMSLRNNAGSEKYQREIGHLVTSFQYAHLDKERATRTVTSRKFNKDSQLQQTKKHAEDEYGVSVSVIEEQEFDEKDGVNASWEGEEERSGNIRSLSVVSSNDGIREEYASQAIQAKAITERIRRKSMMLSCDISTMTMFELHHLISGCIKLMKYNNQYLESARVLLLMLLTGNSFSEVRSWSAIKRDDRGIIGIKREFQLPSHSQREQIKPMLKDVVQEYPCFSLLVWCLVSTISSFMEQLTQT
ncbi:hypothetical protein P7F88_03815 [Vibrio hannami]|uniref:hypothetical protein n=1 Tax=Vibrio hannami TaxID=2717094 RepID=UPI002410B394|nr:hypothetical protein [Vibrio hannami]MDG3085274.1 hypothetical protein [Vibrio hannami]